MPLPAPGTAWPPAGAASVLDKMREWSAWWTGDAADLTHFYQGRAGARGGVTDRPSQRRGGVVGAAARFWWGRPQQDLTQHRELVHVPIAADIARTSADLLFAEPPKLTMPSAAAQAWLEDGGEDVLLSRLTGAGERQAVLGGVYLRVAWDPRVDDGRAFSVAVPADEAYPEFAWGRLVAVTFAYVLADDGQRVVRHLERHELDAAGNGLAQHGVFVGSRDSLGQRAQLEDYPETAALAPGLNEDGYLLAGITPGLLVQYVPNSDPLAAKAWARNPAARHLGASDLDGIEPLLDNLDEIHASWLRDIRLGKARLLVAQYMLNDGGPGGGATFNADQDVFAPLKMQGGDDGDAPITPVQFAIRFAEHKATADQWIDQIIRSAGYSLQTFGDFDGSQMTATEVDSRDARSTRTRGRKVRLWRPELTRHLRKLLATEQALRGTSFGDLDDVRVEFPDGTIESPQQLAQTAQFLRAAEAASTETLVGLTHPEWTEEQVKAEARRILAERGANVAVDPFAIGAGG